jgi:hypothetical protein
MKRFFCKIYIVIAVTLCVGTYSCNYLESEEYLHEVDALNDIWFSRKNIREAWAACYGRMYWFHDISVSWPFSGGGDEGYAGLDTYECLQLAQGKYHPDNIPDRMNYWNGIYTFIRTCNQFLENSHLANDRLLAEGEIETYNTDVRFLRAFYYSLLLEIYGPFVIIEHTIDYSLEDYPTTRNTVDECVDFLVKEFDAVIEKLPHQRNIIQTDLGRPSKGAAMAAKARVLLWSASKLVNGNKDYETSFVNPDGVPYINPEYKKEKWELAAKAYKDIIDLGYYELLALPATEKTVPLGNFEGNDVPWPNGPAGIDPYLSYKALFAGGLNYWNSETIWQINTPNQQTNYTFLGWPRGHKTTGADERYLGVVGAVQKIVDAFFMNNGKTINEENGALYNDMGPAADPDGYYIQGRQTSEASPIKTNWKGSSAVQAPPARCLNREARFYATFGFQGRGWKQDDLVTPYYYIDMRYGSANDGYIETNKPSYRTGYLIVKWVNDEDIMAKGNYTKQCPIYRLAEVYLSYAEALNEIDPTNSDIVKYLNLVRYRAGLPGYELADQDTNRERIKHERYVELAFENGKRYFDMRRWMDAEKVDRDQWGNSRGLGGLVYGCDYWKTDGSFYDRIVLEGYIFKKRDYFFPLPYVEVANHWGTMHQNPGW